MEKENEKPLAKFVTEETILEFLGLGKSQLSYLRLNSKFPCVKVTQNSRLYHLEDVAAWLDKKRIKEDLYSDID